MRPFERRETEAWPYFKLAAWDDRFGVWKAGKVTFGTEAEAVAMANKAGRYRITRIEEHSKTELEPFTVPSASPAPAQS